MTITQPKTNEVQRLSQYGSKVIEVPIVCLLLVYGLAVPSTFVHEGVHYAVGMMDNNVDQIEYHVFDEKALKIGAWGLVQYHFKDASINPILTTEQNELCAYAVSTTVWLLLFFVIARFYLKITLKGVSENGKKNI